MQKSSRRGPRSERDRLRSNASIDRVAPDPLPRIAKDVVLRRLAASDLPAFQSYRHDPQVALYQDWKAVPDAQAHAFLTEMSSNELLLPGTWSQIGIAEPGSARLAGDIGLFLAGDGRHAEIGFTLARESQGRGLGTMAALEAIKLVFELTEADRVLGITDARNAPSIRLLLRAGMRLAESRDAIHREQRIVEHIYAISRQQGA
jgi:RimJ/RimL family protein N-acetyltransferase